MAKSEKIKDQMLCWLLDEMVQAEAAGVDVCVDGDPYSQENRWELPLVMEDGYYMKNYVEDEHGRIVRIDFEHISEV